MDREENVEPDNLIGTGDEEEHAQTNQKSFGPRLPDRANVLGPLKPDLHDAGLGVDGVTAKDVSRWCSLHQSSVSLDRPCARRHANPAVGAKENLRRGQTKEMG